MSARVVLFVLLIAAIILSGCAKKEPALPAQEETPEPPARPDVTATPRTVHADILMSGQGFSPTELSVHKGDTVEFSVTSVDYAHTISFKQLNISGTVDTGAPRTFSFLATRAGPINVECLAGCDPGVYFTIIVQ